MRRLPRSGPALVLPLLLLALPSHARPRPQLSEPAAALLAKEPALLVADDDVLVPLAPKAKSVPFLVPTPKRLELLSSTAQEAWLAIDDDLYRLVEGKLALVATKVFAHPAVASGGKLVASVDDRKTLVVTTPQGARKVAFRKEGRWEFERPFIAPDGKWVLATIRDYTKDLDQYSFLCVDVASLEWEEIAISPTFVPGSLRQPLPDGKVAIQMFTQSTDDQGFQKLEPTDFVAFDFATKKLGPPPPSLRPGLASPKGRYSLLPGALFYSDDKRCGGDQTLLYAPGKDKPSRVEAGPGVVVSLLDFLPDESAVVANVLSLKSCKNRGVLIPLGGDQKPERWAPISLPVHDGRVTGRVLWPASAPSATR